MIRSASSSAPDSSLSPFSVKVSIRSVTIDALPALIDSNRSPSGTRQRRWSHGLVARGEVSVDVVAVRKVLDHAAADHSLHELWPASAGVEEGTHHQDVLPAHERIQHLRGEHAAKQAGERVGARQGDHVARGALHHRHVCGVLRHRRHERHGRGSAADHHHALAGVVESLGPVLRVHDLAAEALAALEVRRVALVVAVVAGAHEEEPARHL